MSLQKYLSEIIAATAEGLQRLKTAADVAAGVEIVSALHQRFGPGDFTKQLAWLLGKGLVSPDKSQIRQWTQDVREREEKERVARHKVLLRVATELWLCGILRSVEDVERPDEVAGRGKEIPQPENTRSSENQKLKNILASIRADTARDNDPFPLEVLKDLLGNDSDLVNLPVAVMFVKNFAWDILGMKVAAEDGKKVGEGEPDLLEEPGVNGVDAAGTEDVPLVAEAIRSRFVAVISRYVEHAKKRVVKDQEALQTQSRRNAEAYVRSGEIFEDRQASFERQVKAQERLLASVQTLCAVMGIDMPNLTTQDSNDLNATGSIGLVKAGEVLRGSADGAGIWEDEEERRFYENLMDLKGRVPAILLEDSKRARPDTDEATPVRSVNSDSSTDKSAPDNEDQSLAIANRTVGAQVDALLLRLPELQNREQVDSVAHDFCFLNSKASRNRLVKALQEIPKGRTDLLPLYARLIATLGQYMPDVSSGMTQYLDDEFRSLQRRKSKDFLGQARMLNIRYLAELTKFGVVPEYVIFHCFKVSLDDFSRMNIEIISNLLEHCGRYLLRNPDTAPRATSLLATLGRKKSAQHLGTQERMLLENALYYVDPPERAAIEQKDRTPTELFIRQLVYSDMTKRNYMKILKTIRKLHWEEDEVVTMLEKIFSKPGKVKFSNIHLLAILLQQLSRYHPKFGIMVIDNVLENIVLGLEQNDFKFSQKRIAEVKYLAELYNYKLVDSSCIFDTLYRIVTFGHENGTPTPGRTTSFDLPDDFFRVRLVITILETCGVCFDRGSSKTKLNFFLTFFQYYVLTKDPLPLEVEFIIQDMFALVRPEWKIVTDLDEAAQCFANAVAAKYRQEGVSQAEEVVEDEEPSSDEALDEEAPGEVDVEDGSDAEAEDAVEMEGEDRVEQLSSEEEQIVVTREEPVLDPEMEAEFDREFAAMMAESLGERKHERQNRFDVPLPVRKVQRAPVEAYDDSTSSADEAPTETTTMAFQLMTKKGNRHQVSSTCVLTHSPARILTSFRLEPSICLRIRILPFR